MHHALWLRLSLLSSLAASVAVAAQAPGTMAPNPVLATATRVPTPGAAVTAAVAVVSGRELQLRGIRTVAEALRTVPGAAVVETGSYGGQTSLFLRGGESDYVKVLVDGVPQNQPGGAFDFADLTTDNVDRIEIVRGPASVLYGSDAVTGVIQIFTRTGSRARPVSPGEAGSLESGDCVRRASGGGLAPWRRAGAAVTAGIDYEDERQTGRSVFTASFGTFPDSINVLRWNTGYYAQALFTGGSPLSLTLGGRVDDNSQFGTHGTFRAGVSYRIDPATRVRAMVGTGYKEPTFFENFARGSVHGNPNLDPERSTSWEAGLERAWGDGRVRGARRTPSRRKSPRRWAGAGTWCSAHTG